MDGFNLASTLSSAVWLTVPWNEGLISTIELSLKFPISASRCFAKASNRKSKNISKEKSRSKVQLGHGSADA
jgi:hypothetical protein